MGATSRRYCRAFLRGGLKQYGHSIQALFSEDRNFDFRVN